MGSNSKSRVVLQFNEMDFRHRRALDILRQRPRSMSELVVNAILHYAAHLRAGGIWHLDACGGQHMGKNKQVCFCAAE